MTTFRFVKLVTSKEREREREGEYWPGLERECYIPLEKKGMTFYNTVRRVLGRTKYYVIRQIVTRITSERAVSVSRQLTQTCP